MKKLNHYQTVVLFLAVLSAGAVFGQPMIDQEQPAVDVSIGGLAIDDYPTSEQKLAQVFVPDRDGRLTHVTVPIGCDSLAKFTVEIVTVAGGVPTSSVLTSETVPGSIFPERLPSFGDVGFRIVQFSAPVWIHAGAEYAIVLKATGSCGIYQSPAGDTYTSGRGWFDARPNPPGWVPIGSYGGRDDLPFQIFTDQCRGRSPSARCAK